MLDFDVMFQRDNHFINKILQNQDIILFIIRKMKQLFDTDK
jgi:hypothetical protein